MWSAVTRLTVLLGAALLLATSGGSSADDAAAKKELDKLQGTWYSLSTQEDGNVTSGEDKADLHLIKGNQVTARKGDKEISTAAISVEPGKPFGKVTIQMKSGDNKDKIWVGIYEVDGDSLKWCGCWKGDNDLPAAFGTKKGDKYFLRAMKRQKD
jgi:uncharacterized protein (TIGR03067 family)